MKKFLILKIAFVLLVGTCHAQLGKVSQLATAIARSEGFYVKGSVPNRYHNPGDITTSKSHVYPGQVGVSKRGYAIFKNDAWGWAALEKQIQRVIDGTSTKYTQEMTFARIARIYAQDPRWGKRVCRILKIDTQMTFAEYFNLPPRVKYVENQHALDFLQQNDRWGDYDVSQLWGMSPLRAYLSPVL